MKMMIMLQVLVGAGMMRTVEMISSVMMKMIGMMITMMKVGMMLSLVMMKITRMMIGMMSGNKKHQDHILMQ